MSVLDLVRTQDPAPLVSLDRAKRHLRVDGTVEDEDITDLVAAAVEAIDGYSGRLGRAIVTQTWALHLPRFPACRQITLPLPPLQSVTSIAYVDAAGDEQTLSSGAYDVLDGPKSAVVLKSDQAWPSTGAHPRAVTITFVAGYGAPEAVPKTIVSAVLLAVGELYANREGDGPSAEKTISRLLSGVRKIRV